MNSRCIHVCLTAESFLVCRRRNHKDSVFTNRINLLSFRLVKYNHSKQRFSNLTPARSAKIQFKTFQITICLKFIILMFISKFRFSSSEFLPVPYHSIENYGLLSTYCPLSSYSLQTILSILTYFFLLFYMKNFYTMKI